MPSRTCRRASRPCRTRGQGAFCALAGPGDIVMLGQAGYYDVKHGSRGDLGTV